MLQGNTQLVKNCHLVSTTRLKGIPPAPAGEQKILIKYAVDKDGLLEIYAKSYSNPTNEINLTIEADKFTLDDSTMERLVNVAEV